MIDRLVLLLPVGGCLLFGAILIMELAPAGAEDPVIAEAARSDAASPITRAQNPRPEELVTTTLARPLFSSARRPPQDAPSGAANSDLTDARLTGIVTTPSHRMAIFAVNGDKPLKVAEGDAVSGWRVEGITPREVSLSGPTGTKTLQPKLDPNLAALPGQPPGGRVPTAPAAGRPRLPMPGAAPTVVQPPPGVPLAPPGTPPRTARLRQQR
jgi:general secretion pathway protein N